MEKWYKLDNAAKLFPSVVNEKNSSVYRISVVLKEHVNAVALQQATDTVMVRFPMLTVRLRKGVFWNYLDANHQQIVVEEDHQYPCSNIDPENNNGYLFRILYYKNRVSVEMFHALADGSGAVEFLKSLLYYYFLSLGKKIEPEGKILLADTSADKAEMEDSFCRYYKDCYVESSGNRKAYQIKGASFNISGTNVTHGVVSASLLNQIAKKKGATITAYLTALLIYSIYQTRVQSDRKNAPIVVAVPVNLRKAFPSKTLRNFFGVVNIGSIVREDTTFDELIIRVQDMLKHKVGKENLQNIIYNNLNLERNKSTMFIPLLLKKWFVNYGFKALGESKKTVSLSNLGNVLLPQEMTELVELVETVMYPTNKSPINCGVSSVNDRMTITFTRSIVETDILQYFFAYLANESGLEVKVYSNDWGDKI